jgi:hypothetical protein
MDPKILAVIVVAVVVFLILAFVIARKQRTAKLRKHFGTEYDRAVRDVGAQRADAVLLEREKRVEKFQIHELPADQREQFVSDWRIVQSRFVDDPQGAVAEADVLVNRLMLARGYPMSDFEQRAADISVTHPRVVENYRAARIIALRHAQGQANTEDLRNAMIYYRSLFEELLQTGTIRHTREVA